VGFLHATHIVTQDLVFKVMSERPMISTAECRALDDGAITNPNVRFDAASVTERSESRRILTRGHFST
jgi:hypothetical protein